MKVLYLFNKILGETVEEIKKGKGHDSWLFGMLRLKKHGIDSDFLEVEKFIPKRMSAFLRKRILTMHYAHLPLFPLFFRYDVIFTSTAYSSLFLKALLRIKRFKWVVLDFNILGTLQEEKTFKQKIFAYAITHGADGIVAISEAERDALKMRFPHLKEKIIFLHEATDTDFFTPDTTPEKNMILSVGNYARDFTTLIEASAGLKAELLLATKLIKPEDQKTLPSHVKVAHLSHDEVLRAYKEASMAVVSLNTKDTYFDSVGTLALGEAMAMGKATIVTHTKSMESYIDDGVNGIFVERKNVEKMKESLKRLLEDSALRRRLGDNARHFALKNLDPDVFAEKLAIFLKTVV